MTRAPTAAFLFALVTGCSHDFGLNENVVDSETPPDDADELVLQDPSDPFQPDWTEPTGESPPPPEDDCEDTDIHIYVIDRAEEALYLFDPSTLDFTFVGDLDCGMFEGTPASMAVARDGFAYVRYSSNALFAVDLLTMQCSETSYANNSFGSFGMGYATDDDTTWHDALYLGNAQRLAVVDTTTWTRTPIGALPSQSELTGNAAGELWAFLPLENPARLVQLDKDDATVIDAYSLPGFPNPSNLDTFAFATWGGDFYLFVRSYGMGETTEVYKVDGGGAMTLVAPDTGRDVVGAGVSTCAPMQ